jgi:hypothetical protein
MSEVMTREEYQIAIAKPKRGNKFGAKRTLVDGICFDSKREAAYYAALKLRERAGEVTDVELQVPFDLIVNGVLVARYIADMVFFDHVVHHQRIIDVKGCVTPTFRLKAKLMKACHGIEIEVVR